jgi:hypothetical protein
MTEVDLEAGLKSMRKSLRQMKALLAWEQLKLAEAKSHQPPAFKINDPIEEDLKSEYSFFLSTSVQMHSILNDDLFTIKKTEHQNISKQLAKIEQQVYGLNLHQRICMC